MLVMRDSSTSRWLSPSRNSGTREEGEENQGGGGEENQGGGGEGRRRTREECPRCMQCNAKFDFLTRKVRLVLQVRLSLQVRLVLQVRLFLQVRLSLQVRLFLQVRLVLQVRLFLQVRLVLQVRLFLQGHSWTGALPRDQTNPFPGPPSPPGLLSSVRTCMLVMRDSSTSGVLYLWSSGLQVYSTCGLVVYRCTLPVV
ncbi:hypothetical protein CRUP_023010 [Coryphaenoides rupestris]|nr:hypothetical protein CRUP_023010 [Coryphaenoides rupestris]